MTTGDLLVRATAWLAFAAYIGGTVAGLRQPSGRVFRLVWLAGAVLLLVHLIAAFHFKHGWSHAAAYVDTARQTREVTGLDWGGGVYLNYLLVIVWLADAASRWKPNLIVQPPVLRRSLAAFYAFMWFNAAVVFVRNPMRWVGAVAFVLLAVFAWRQLRSVTGVPLSDPAR
ncbi:MAG: hypothetical protein ABMA26_07740 [Limisphaerales bacterium]